MGNLISALVQQFVEAIFGTAIDATVEQASRRFFRRLAWVVAFVTAAWIAVASAFL
jgi:hypothetical protein